jgi:UDP-N-acetylmuramoyl-L-alanyl-D-glutamate--2,6-diaminopimelate ligase
VKLSEVIKGIPIVDRINFTDTDIRTLATDSRGDVDGGLFIAVTGQSDDGHEYVGQAADRGANALIVEKPISSTLPTLVVDDSAAAAAHCAKNFYGDPASRVLLVGASGTNGKTSTCFLLRSILDRALGPTGIIGTVGFGTAGELTAATHTTPATVDLYRIIAGFADRGCEAVVMEVSSHATVQRRIEGLEFDLAIMTNITRDHLDYHRTMASYIAAKETFVGTLTERGRRKKAGTLVYNVDDPHLVAIAERFSGSAISYGIANGADVTAADVRAGLDGSRFGLSAGGRRATVNLPLLGSFSVYNALAAAAGAHGIGIAMDDIAAGLERVDQIPGRFQVIAAAAGPKVVVDYAHTPDALENLLRFCRELGPRRLITVFGCGGDRDRGKRPLMGAIAVNLSDVVYITDDNPRTEDPDGIVAEIVAGIDIKETSYAVVRDRARAIREAVRGAGPGDLVVVAGKGHEEVQIVGDRRIPFSDAHQAREALGDAEVEHQS